MADERDTTPAAPDPAPDRPHGDPLTADEEGSRHGTAPSPAEDGAERAAEDGGAAEDGPERGVASEEAAFLAQAGEAVPETGESAVEEDLVALSAKRDEYLELAQRTRADFDNYRRRMAREVGAAESRGMAKLAKELLPALDNLGRAVAAADGGGEGLLEGVRLVHAELLRALERVGIQPYDPAGERFDPQAHEAMAQQPVEGAEPGTIVAVYAQGFRHGDTVLRPARVVVAG